MLNLHRELNAKMVDLIRRQKSCLYDSMLIRMPSTSSRNSSPFKTQIALQRQRTGKRKRRFTSVRCFLHLYHAHSRVLDSEHAEVFPVDIKLDYKPRRVDYRALRDGRTIELMNFFHFDGAEMTLRHLTLHGVRPL